MKLQWYNFIFTASFLLQTTHQANILYLNCVASPSHFLWNRVLIYGLAERGHNLTVLSLDVDEESANKNVHFLQLNNVYDGLQNGSEKKNHIEMGKMEVFKVIYTYDQYKIKICNLALKAKGFQDILKYPNDFKFDLVINDYLAGPCLLSLMHKFSYPPLISVSGFNSPAQAWNIAGALEYSSIVPTFNLDFVQMNFYNRFRNFIVSLFDVILKKYYQIPNIDRAVRQTFPDLPYINEFNKLTKLVLMNSHPAVQFVEPMPPNVISVGGMQIQKPTKLPPDMREMVENAKNGVILFSLGTNVRSDSLGDQRIINILDAMRQLSKYQFLWKFESKNLPQKIPDNVFIRSWMPQNDILAHANTKLFISHCGLLSIQEAVWYSVPIVGFPIFADQFKNINYIVARDAAIRLSISSFTASELVEAIENVLGKTNYLDNMKVLSNSFRDQPETALERAIWWTEWVLRYPDTDVMISSSLHQGIFERHSYDVVFILYFALLSFIYLLGYVFLKCMRK